MLFKIWGDRLEQVDKKSNSCKASGEDGEGGVEITKHRCWYKKYLIENAILNINNILPITEGITLLQLET